MCIAEENREAVFDLGQILITPTKTEKAIGDLSLSASVVTKQEIEASTANSATDILNILPGVFVHKTGSFGRADVVIRGQGSRGRRVMVLVDGKPEKMGLFGCTITHSLPLDNVERIEVVRGPASVLYGSDALGGVINIITKKPTEKSKGDATLSYGSFDSQVYRLRQGQDLGQFNYYFSVDERKSRGHLPNTDYEHKNYTLRLGRQINEELESIFNFRYFDGFKNELSPIMAYSWNNYERGAYDLTFQGDWQDAQGMLKLYRNFGEHKFSDGWHSKDYTTGAMAHLGLVPMEDNALTLGWEFREQAGKVLSGTAIVLTGKYDKDESALFIHDEQGLFNQRLIASGGLRYNDDELAGDIFCPQAGLVFHLSDRTSLRGSLNRGFRAPGLNELKFYTMANPDLKPERSWNYELGFNQKINDIANLDFTYFITHAKNFIRVSAGKYENLDKMDFRGFETSLEYKLLRNLTSRLSFSHLDVGKYTQGRPENELDLSLFFKEKRWTISLTGQYVDNYFGGDDKTIAIPNFFLIDSKVIYDISFNWEIFLAINNLFNVEHKIYADLPGSSAGVYTQPGRTISFGSVYKW